MTNKPGKDKEKTARQNDVLRTKLVYPRLRPRAVKRERLVEILNAGRDKKLTIICAPAGYGKTTLLSAWLEGIDEDRAWMSLGAGDDDIVRFLALLVHALQVVFPGVGAGLLSEVQSPQRGDILPEVSGLLNDLHDLDRSVMVVIDDYHLVSDNEIHQALDFVIENLPPNVHLFIASRSDPPLRVSRLRAAEELVEVRLEDMAFTEDEVVSFFCESMSVDLPAEVIGDLNARFEGWPVALQLAAISIKDRTDPIEFVRRISEEHRFVADYLTEEVLAGQESDVQAFLVKTSILDQMSAPLCAAVTGLPDTAAMIEQLERDNLFVVAMDEKRNWFRYHHLFAELLRLRIDSGELAVLHGKAAAWFAENGYPNEAIAHFIIAGEFDAAAATIAATAQDALMRLGETATVSRWVAALPDGVVYDHPRVTVAACWSAIYALRTDEARKHLANLEQRRRETGAKEFEEAEAVEIEIVRATVSTLGGEMDDAIMRFQAALKRISRDDELSGVALMGLGYAYQAIGRTDDAQRAHSDAIDANLRSGFIGMALKSAAFASVAQISAGRIREAELSLRGALLVADEHGLARSGVMANVYCSAAEVARLTDDVDSVAKYLDSAFSVARRGNDPLRMWTVLVTAAMSAVSQNAPDAALEHLAAAEKLVAGRPMPLAQTRVSSLKALASLMRDGPSSPVVEQFLVDFQPSHEWILFAGAMVIPGQSCDTDHLVCARIHVERNQTAEAARVLDEARSIAGTAGRLLTLTLADLLMSRVHEKNDAREDAVETLARALRRAEPEGIIRPFLDEGASIEGPLNRLVESHSGDTSFADRIVATVRSQQRVGRRDPLDVISRREIEILQLMARRLTNAEIGETLFISHNTVKTHIKSIMTKLDVHRRTDAVSEARRRGVL